MGICSIHQLDRLCRFVALGTLVAGGACYRYVPVQLATVQPDEEVRVSVTESAAVRLVRELGAYTGHLEGRLAPVGRDSIDVAVMIDRRYGTHILESAPQAVSLAITEVVDVRQRRLSRSRTVVASAGVLVGFAVLVGTIVHLVDPNTDTGDPPPPPPPALRWPVRASIRIPLTIP